MMISNYKKAWKLWSVQLSAIAATVAGLATFLPSVEAHVSPAVFAALSILTIIARVSSQPKLQTPEQLWDSALKAKDAAKKGGLILLVLICVGCTEPRHPERDACYLRADATAAREYMTECADYPDTRACPAGDAIEARHAADQEACP